MKYVVTSENGARTVECLGKPDGRYLSMRELVDLEVGFRTYRGKTELNTSRSELSRTRASSDFQKCGRHIPCEHRPA